VIASKSSAVAVSQLRGAVTIIAGVRVYTPGATARIRSNGRRTDGTIAPIR
jgi:hypothetical protein